MDFFNVLTGPELLEQTEAHLPEHRERLYPPTVTLAMFMRQALNEDRSCQKAVNGWAAQRVAEGLAANGVDTGAYCRARQRLPVEMVMAPTRESGRLLSEKALPGWRWRGRTVKLVDGSTISMPDTPQNQELSAAEQSGAGRRLSFSSHPRGDLPGKSELGLLRAVGEMFNSGDVMLADAFYCNYFIIATLQSTGVDAVFEQHGGRITDFRRGRPLGARDHRVRWAKPARPSWMTREQYASFPDELTVRELKTASRTVQLWTEWTARKIPARTDPQNADLWQLIADIRVAERPGRVEPRMKKRRPKSYPWMKKSRSQERGKIMVHGTLRLNAVPLRLRPLLIAALPRDGASTARQP